MKVGGRRQLTIPPELAYGPAGGGHRLSGRTLIFVIDLLGRSVSTTPAIDDLDVLGPVDFAVVDVPGGVHQRQRLRPAPAAGRLRSDPGPGPASSLTRIADGSVERSRRWPRSASRPGVDLSPFAGASSGSGRTPPTWPPSATRSAVGSVAAVLVYEEQVLIPVVQAWHTAGGRLALVGHLEPADLDEALDADRRSGS